MQSFFYIYVKSYLYIYLVSEYDIERERHHNVTTSWHRSKYIYIYARSTLEAFGTTKCFESLIYVELPLPLRCPHCNGAHHQ